MLRRDNRRNSSPAMVRASDTTTFLDPIEKTKKKLSFREPEILGYYMQMKQGVTNRLSRKSKSKNDTNALTNGISKSCIFRNQASESNDEGTGNDGFNGSTEDFELENRALRVVKCVGQAFEEVPKLSINSTTSDDREDKAADSGSSHNDSKFHSEANTKNDFSRLESQDYSSSQKLKRLDIVVPSSVTTNGGSPPSTNGVRRESVTSGMGVFGSPTEREFSSKSLSTYHELKLLRTQVEQQRHQTEAAVAQMHLLKDQLVAESNARLEAQTRTHQLLVHNKELLDHITSLVDLLQQHEKLFAQQQQLRFQSQLQQSQATFPNIQPFSSLSPIPTTRPITYNFGYPSANDQFQAQLLQHLQTLNNSYHNQRRTSLYEPQSNSHYVPEMNHSSFRASQACSYSSSPNLSLVSVVSSNKVENGDAHSIKQLSNKETSTVKDEDGRVKAKVSVNDNVPVPRLEPPPSTHKRSGETLPPKLGNQTNKSTTSHKTITNRDESVRKPIFKHPVESPITRTTSEKVPHRSELMSHVQRKAWARHTMK